MFPRSAIQSKLSPLSNMNTITNFKTNKETVQGKKDKENC